jgi:hypothetical protein
LSAELRWLWLVWVMARGMPRLRNTRRSIASVVLWPVPLRWPASETRRRRTASLAQYREAKYIYERQVDAHGHWIGLAMLLMVLGVAFDRVAFAEKWKLALAIALLAGAALFPMTVLLQTFSHGSLPRILTIASSALMIATLAITALGLALNRRPS